MDIQGIINLFINNWQRIAELIAAIIGVASLIVKMTPTLKDDNMLLPIIKFISKYIALNTPTPTSRPT